MYGAHLRFAHLSWSARIDSQSAIAVTIAGRSPPADACHEKNDKNWHQDKHVYGECQDNPLEIIVTEALSRQTISQKNNCSWVLIKRRIRLLRGSRQVSCS